MDPFDPDIVALIRATHVDDRGPEAAPRYEFPTSTVALVAGQILLLKSRVREPNADDVTAAIRELVAEDGDATRWLTMSPDYWHDEATFEAWLDGMQPQEDEAERHIELFMAAISHLEIARHALRQDDKG